MAIARAPRRRSIPFEKYHGCRNDFVLVDALAHAWLADVAWDQLAPLLCDRRAGIGADGVLLVCEGDRAAGSHARMTIFNPDGSDGGMCGNGIRCVGKHLVERHGMPVELRVEVGPIPRPTRGLATPPRTLRCHAMRDDAGTLIVNEVTVDMGSPAWEAERVPVRVPGHAPTARVVDMPLPEGTLPALGAVRDWWHACGDTDEPTPRMTCVSMGNPHAVIWVRDVERVPLEHVGPMLETLSCFPARANIQFAQRLGPTHAKVRTWERGAGATPACGTGACAVAAALAQRERGTLATAHPPTSAGAPITIELPGGVLTIEVGETIRMRGSAARSYTGEWAG